jgi:steroid 5-alpha reductase family enzyme
MLLSSIPQPFIEIAVILFVYLTSMVIITCYKGDTSIGNFTWGGGVLIVTLYTFLRVSSFLLQQIIVTAMICLWSTRLIAYVYHRYTGKDPRFKHWKWQGFKALIINSFWIFGQSIMIAIMSLPVAEINTYNVPHALSMFDILGVIIWIVGYMYESISDYQLSQFMHKPENKGHVMSSGLWHYSRHPNYFGESLMWVGIFFMAVSVSYYGLVTIITPITITFLLVYVTGIPLLEKAMANNSEYQEYKKHTSKFIPWFRTQ